MAHIVFILDDYYPNFQAVGICVRNVINELKKENEITVICQKTEIDEDNIERFEETQIVRIQTKLNSFKHYFIAKSNKSCGITKKLYKRLSDSIRLYRYLNALFSKVILQNDVVESYLNSLTSLHKRKKIDIIIPCASPFESCVAGVRFKLNNKEVKFMPYMFDNYAFNIAIYRNSKLFYKQKLQNHIKLERLVIGESDNILCMKHYAESYSKIHNKKNILSIVEHPLLVETEKINNFNFDKEKINIAYTGGLFKKIRNPKYALTVLSNVMRKNSNIELHIFGSGNCSSIINAFVKKNPNQIIYHGYVSSIVAESARNSCDYLLSIGNCSNSQIPSKTFEYMSSLKPIIHFSKIREDKTAQILSNYPNTCFLFEDFNLLEKNCKMINQFFNKKIEVFSFQTLKEIFSDALPSYTSEKIKKILN
jgi:glycosyltransferase involved in cell wall biosynthesis